MAYRFGRSNWQNKDRLNLLKVYQENATWDDRLKAMREIYASSKYPLGYFTENVCREEVERILSEPTPNLRINVSPTFVYSRKIMIEKWIEYFQAEHDKNQKKDGELTFVDSRSNNTVIREIAEGASSDRLDEILAMIKSNPDRNPNDGNYKRIFGAVEAALVDFFENGGKIDVDALDIPATNPVDDFVHSDNGYIPDVGEKYDYSFFTPPIEMLTLAEVAQVAVPAIANTMAEPKAPVDNEFPDDLLESATTTDTSSNKETDDEKAEVKQDEEEVAEEMEVGGEDEAVSTPQDVPASESPLPEKPAPKEEESPASDVSTSSKKSAVTQSTKPQSSTQVKSTRAQQKKKDPLPLPINVEDIKEEQSAPPSPVTENVPSTSGNPRLRGRPRHQSNSSSSATPTTSKKADRDTSPEEDSSESVPVKKPRHDRSQEPSTSSSTRNSRNVPTAQIHLKTKEGTPLSTVSSTISRSESGFDLQGDATTSEVETQTYMSVRHHVNITERRAAVPPSTKRGRKSLASKERSALARPNSGNSSSSKPSTGSISPTPLTYRTVATNTGNVTLTQEEQVLHDDEQNRNYIASIDTSDRILGPMNMDTMKEIEEENAVAAVAAAAAALEDPEREAYPPPAKGFWTLLVQADPSVAKALIEKKGFTLANAEDYIPAADSPIKPRRSNVPKNDQTRQNLLMMLRSILNCQFGNPFKRPVPTTEELYCSGVFERIDLSGIKKEIEHGDIRDPVRFLLRLYRMCSNAIMFNGYDHDVHLAALFITKQYLKDLLTKTEDIETLPAQRTRAKDKNGKERGRGMERDRESEEPPTPSRSSSMDTDNNSTPDNDERRPVPRRNQNNEGTPTTEANGRRKKRV